MRITKREFRAAFFCALFFSVATLAFPAIRPLASIAIGGDLENTPTSEKNIVLLSPFHNTYLSGGKNWQPVAGLFIGGELSFRSRFLGQLGLSYYQNKAYTITGNVYQFGDPSFNNLSFQYYLKSQRIMVDSKILTTYKRRFHPFITLGAGEAFNQAYRYVETPESSADVSKAQPFHGRLYHSFAYELGVGLDVDIDAHLRCGAAYRYVDLGSAGLGGSPTQVSSQTINYSHMRVSEFIAQLSYLV